MGASARRPAARLLPAERDARPAHRRGRQELRHRLRAGAPRGVERPLPVPGRGRPERHRGAAPRTDGAGRCRARARLRRRHHRHRSSRRGLRRVLHGRAAGEPGLRLPGGRARGRARPADRRAALRQARRARVLHGLLDRRARGHADGAALSDVFRRHRRRRAGDAYRLLRHRRRMGRDDAEPRGAARRLGEAGPAPRVLGCGSKDGDRRPARRLRRRRRAARRHRLRSDRLPLRARIPASARARRRTAASRGHKSTLSPGRSRARRIRKDGRSTRAFRSTPASPPPRAFRGCSPAARTPWVRRSRRPRWTSTRGPRTRPPSRRRS